MKIGSPDQGKVPASAAAMGQDGPILYSVSQEDGALGEALPAAEHPLL